MGFGGSIRPEIIPERVYALLKLVNYKKNTKDKLKEYLQPKKLNKKRNIFNIVYNFCLNNNLIIEDADGFVISQIDKKVVQSHKNFRKFMAKKLLKDDNESLFFKYTSWYLAQDEKIFKYKSSEELQQNLIEGDLVNFKKQDLNGWRFWAKFLGVGFMHEVQRGSDFIIPNTYIRLKDVIEEIYNNKDNNKDKRISFGDFMNNILNECPELKKGIVENNISLGVSMGLRNLHDQGFIELKNIKDAEEIWHLFRSDFHSIQEDVTEVVIKGGELNGK